MDKKLLTSIVFHNLRTLHGVTPQDTYIENYKWHLNKCGDEFFDLHALAFEWGAKHHPSKILEIGSRTGLSLAAILSAYIEFPDLRVCVFDMFDDGLCSPDLIKKHMAHLSIPTEGFEFYKGDSRITIPEFKKDNKDKFGWIVVDGGHSDEVASVDLENVVDLVESGGVIAFDDISATMESDGFDIKQTWENFKTKHINEFCWRQDTAGKGTAWCQKI
jgi:predicted O-methyltransferase YrrM